MNEMNSKTHGVAEWNSAMLQQRCPHGHSTTLTEILSRNVILDAVPCPCCVESRQVPPHCFNRQECLLYFSEDMLTGTRTGSVQCLLCAKTGRASASIQILDVIAPEVFMSYKWGCDNSTQKLVKPLWVTIEQDADVVMWFDVGGGMGAGQAVKAEMEQGVLKCTVVLIFISDAYCASDNCIREFLHATKHSKFLVVCLTPSGGQTRTGDLGWTGPGTEDEHCWHHATKMSSCKDPDTGKLFSWSALGQFTPIDLRIEHGASEKEAKRVQEDAVLEIVKCIMSRFHRGEHIQYANEQYVYWEKVALLDSFTADNLEEIRREATSIFKKLDADKNGNISKQELLKGILQLDDKTADLLIAEADADKDGSISFEEFWGMKLTYHANMQETYAT